MKANVKWVDGLTMVEGLRFNQNAKNMPVIFMTANRDPATLAKSANLKARYYISKPFENDKLLLKVRQVLGGQ